MEAERQRYEVRASFEADGKVKEITERRVGGPEKFEFGAPNDAMSAAIGGGYISHWNVDYLQNELGKEGTCARFYYDRKIAVDIGDPEAEISKRKRKMLFHHGIGYLCIPKDFPQKVGRLKELFRAAVEEYYNWEKLHPRPAVLQETTIIDEKGQVRRALVTAIDVKVGGGLTGSVEQQQQEVQRGLKLSKDEVKRLRLQAKFHRRLRRAVQAGIPFRNPFITKTRRQFPVQYAS